MNTTPEEYLDAAGHQRWFLIQEYAEGSFLQALECDRTGAPIGMRITMPVAADGTPPYWEMRQRIRERLATRHLVYHPDTQDLHLLTHCIRAQIASRDATGGPSGVPTLLIDDLEVGWDELGRLLMSFEGFGLRIDVVPCGAE